MEPLELFLQEVKVERVIAKIAAPRKAHFVEFMVKGIRFKNEYAAKIIAENSFS